MHIGKQGIRFALILSTLAFTQVARADVIDPFTFAQGPYTVGPGEEVTEEEGIAITDTVLGGFRVAVPVVGEDAAAGSTAMMDIAGGVFECTLDFPNVDAENNGGGCGTGYDRGDGPVFDLTAVSQFEVDVVSGDGSFNLAVTLIDTDENLSFGFIEGVSTGVQVMPVAGFFNPSFGGLADLSKIDSIALGVVNVAGQEGTISIGSFGTDGAITGGPVIDNPDDIVAEEISGTWTNFSRDGEGCQLTLERDGVTFILTCYFYANGEQFWLIDIGVLIDGQVSFTNLVTTSGADFGTDFSAADVVRTTWGTGLMTFKDCNNAELVLTPSLAGFVGITLEFTRLVPATCGSGGLQTASSTKMGTYYDPGRDGEGFQLTVEGDGTIYVITWYTYLNGEQVWLIGSTTGDDTEMVFDNMVITNGAGFGSAFNPGDVVRIPFGTVTLKFNTCNTVSANVDPILPEFGEIDIELNKIVTGLCP